MPHPALVEHVITPIITDPGATFDSLTATFDDPDVLFDSVDLFHDGIPYIVIDQRFLRGPERPAVFYDEITRSAAFDSMSIMFDSLLVPFDDLHHYVQNFSSRKRDTRRRRPSVVVLG